jgi:oligogalacturonide lyase
MKASWFCKTASYCFTNIRLYWALIIGFLFIAYVLNDGYAQSSRDSVAIPDTWIDSSTGHTIVRLSHREGNNTSFYFHNNPFIRSTDGTSDWMLYYSSTEQGRQLFVVDLATQCSTQLTHQTLPMTGEIVARKHREALYQCGDTVFATQIDTRVTRVLYVFPDTVHGTITTLNADETLLAGTFNTGDAEQSIIQQYPLKSQFFKRIYEAHIPHFLFTIDLQTKILKVIHQENEWTNHVQFSPTDPNCLMYCHEGPWEKVDRIWIIDVRDGSTRLMHKRTMENEIAGHEFWSPDGTTIWFDLQMPKSENFFLAGVSLATGTEVRYWHQRNEWSIHYNTILGQALFCGDGADSTQVARGTDASWIYLFHPDGDHFSAERLVNMKWHHYQLEPNVHFSPDGKWIIFRSNMFGPTNVFAVKL